MLLDYFAGRRPGHIHGHIAAADDHYFLADRELVAEIDVQQEVDSLVHTVEIDTRNTQIATAMCTYGDKHRVEALAA